MNRYICIHGHFYQPPRENPWLEAIETQDSATPYHDWNERITIECYSPNASARIMDTRDQILRIVNNYVRMSFNFGPTLLSWLRTSAPDTYQAVLDADRGSRERFGGHGNAIAQIYNHIILPLANARDQRTQIRWGIADFVRRFGREPEGMWLPETAVDVESLEALAAAGITFTILEPHQALHWRAIGDDEWSGAGLDPTIPYRCTLPSGRSIVIFFYDGPVSRAVAFEQLLARGELFAHRLLGAFDDGRDRPQLVNIATDGETYGHHHRYGDMALAYALHYIEENELARITNYGQFLELHPPAHEVEIIEKTAWSCTHGVERWRSDCGCNTGAGPGWNQKWRTPLRDALDWLRDRVAEIFEKDDALRDPWAARDDYIHVVLDRSDDNVDAFLARHAKPGADAVRVLSLLEMQRNAMLMYTSCGWFFNDISGLETVQVLQYAGRVVQLAEQLSGEPLEDELMHRLSAAQSNLPELGDGRRIYQRDVLPTRLDLGRVAAHYAVASLFDDFGEEARVYCYRVKRSAFATQRAGRARIAVGSITVTSIITRESAVYDFAVLHLGETELTGGVRDSVSPEAYASLERELLGAMEPGGIPSVIRILDQRIGEHHLSIRALFRDEQRRILNVLCNSTLVEAESAFRQLHERYDPLMRFHTRLGVPLPKVLQIAAEFDLNRQLRRLLEQDDLPLDEIESRLREGRDERVNVDETTVMTLKHAIDRVSEEFREDAGNIERLEKYARLVSIVRDAQLWVNLRKPQNDYYVMKSSVRPTIKDEHWLELFDSLGARLHISPEAAA